MTSSLTKNETPVNSVIIELLKDVQWFVHSFLKTEFGLTNKTLATVFLSPEDIQQGCCRLTYQGKWGKSPTLKKLGIKAKRKKHILQKVDLGVGGEYCGEILLFPFINTSSKPSMRIC